MKNINQKIYKFILTNKKRLAERILSRQFYYQPELRRKYKDGYYRRCLDDVSNYLSYFSEAINMDSLELLNDYILWAKVLPQNSNIRAENIVINLNCIKEILCTQLSKEGSNFVNHFIDAAIKSQNSTITSSKNIVDNDNAYLDILSEYLEKILKLERMKASKLIMDEVEKGTSIKELYVYVFEPALKEIGRLWQINKITVAQEHYFTAATQLIMAQLYSRIFESNKNGLKFVAVCVSEEIHEVGIRMVSDVLELEGWDTYYLGANVPKIDLVNFLIDQKPHVLGISVTMTFHLQKARELIEEIRNNKELKDIKILVGGYPFNVDNNLWKKIGADIYAPNAIETAALLASIFKSAV